MNVTGVNHPASPLEFFAISFTFINSVIFERQEGGKDEIFFAFVTFVDELHFQMKV